jgi:hypothetical protein
MDGKPDERVLHDEAGGPDAKLNWDGPGNPFVKGAMGRALWMRGQPLKDHVIIAKYPQADHDKLTIVAWVYAEAKPYVAPIVCNWADTDGVGQFWLGLWEGTDLGLAMTQRDGKKLMLREGKSHPLPSNQWQHVALTADGSTVRLYRQGREVASTKHAGIEYPVRLSALGIGTRMADSGQAVSRQFSQTWAGKLDEVAIFNNALSADDIRKLAAFGR